MKKDVGNPAVVHHLGQSIRTEQDQIVWLERVSRAVGLNDVPNPQRARQDMAQGVRGSVFRRELSAPDMFFDQGVILRELEQGTIAEQIGPAVAHVSETQARGRTGRDAKHDESGAHAAQVWMLDRVFADGMVGGLDELAQLDLSPGLPSLRKVACAGMASDPFRNGLHRQSTGHVSSRMPSHAIGHDPEADIIQHSKRVLIGSPDPPNICESCSPPGEALSHLAACHHQRTFSF